MPQSPIDTAAPAMGFASKKNTKLKQILNRRPKDRDVFEEGSLTALQLNFSHESSLKRPSEYSYGDTVGTQPQPKFLTNSLRLRQMLNRRGKVSRPPSVVDTVSSLETSLGSLELNIPTFVSPQAKYRWCEGGPGRIHSPAQHKTKKPQFTFGQYDDMGDDDEDDRDQENTRLIRPQHQKRGFHLTYFSPRKPRKADNEEARHLIEDKDDWSLPQLAFDLESLEEPHIPAPPPSSRWKPSNTETLWSTEGDDDGWILPPPPPPPISLYNFEHKVDRLLRKPPRLFRPKRKRRRQYHLRYSFSPDLSTVEEQPTKEEEATEDFFRLLSFEFLSDDDEHTLCSC